VNAVEGEIRMDTIAKSRVPEPKVGEITPQMEREHEGILVDNQVFLFVRSQDYIEKPRSHHYKMLFDLKNQQVVAINVHSNCRLLKLEAKEL
jgi:hypothetical protein